MSGKRDKGNISSVVNFEDLRSATGEDIVNLFAEYFSKMYSDRDYALHDSLPLGNINVTV